MQYIGKIKRSLYCTVTSDITTDEVIITDNQIAHIRERHPNDYEKYYSYFRQIIENPDYILEANKPNTAVVLKQIIENDKNFQLVLRLKTSNDPTHFKNSIITFLRINDKEWKRLLNNKKILYKNE